jgi:hypothetical protein
LHNTKHANESCFITHPSSLTTLGNARCIDPVTLFEDQTKQRCSSHRSCDTSRDQDKIKTNTGNDVMDEGQVPICVKPHSSAGLLRISFLKDTGDVKEHIIVWKGPRREVWEQGAYAASTSKYMDAESFGYLDCSHRRGVPSSIANSSNFPTSGNRTTSRVRMSFVLPRSLYLIYLISADICEPSRYAFSFLIYCQYELWMEGRFSMHSWSMFYQLISPGFPKGWH